MEVKAFLLNVSGKQKYNKIGTLLLEMFYYSRIFRWNVIVNTEKVLWRIDEMGTLSVGYFLLLFSNNPQLFQTFEIS